MVTLGKKYGRLANRLWIFSYFAANAIEYKYPLTYRNFDEYIKYFDSTSKNDFGGHAIRARLSGNIVLDHLLFLISMAWIAYINKYRERGKSYEIMRIKDQGDGFDLNSAEFVEKARKLHVVIRQGGYWYKDNENLARHGDLIRKFFEPKRKYRENIDGLIARCRQKGDCIVGIHLRKTDFARAYQGMYFYDDGVYRKRMTEIDRMLKEEGKTPVFVLCSDEKIVKENFEGINFVEGNDHLVEDLYTFAKCDYLAGPPSTYTSWASFYGRVPVKFLLENTPIQSTDDFKVVENISQVYHLLEAKPKNVPQTV